MGGKDEDREKAPTRMDPRLLTERKETERKLERKLGQFAQSARAVSARVQASCEEDRLEQAVMRAESHEFECEKLLENLVEVNEEIEEGLGQATALEKKQHEVRRQKAADLHDEFERSKRLWRTKRDQSELLEECRKITASREGLDILDSEASCYENSARLLDHMQGEGEGAQASLNRQKDSMHRALDGAEDILSKLPGVNRILMRVKEKEQRDRIIMGCLLGLLACFTLWYLVH